MVFWEVLQFHAVTKHLFYRIDLPFWLVATTAIIIGKVGAVMFSIVKSAVRRILRPPLHRTEPHLILGTSYGGWPLLVDRTPRDALVYSFGVGEDISFDLAAIEKFGCNVHAFDPTPRCKSWIASQSLPQSFRFHAVGLSAADEEVEFFAPENDDYVSFSASPSARSDLNKKIAAPVRRLETIMREHGHAKLDVLKMDIEGFEYGVIDDILSGSIRPQQWLIEFHHRMYGIETDRTRSAVEKIRAAGYKLFYLSPSGHEYGFVYIR
jgi:FkbM family methyltransferase